MDSADDFVVVDEDSEKRTELERLKVLVELFTKALDSLNQSNVLLKDELQSALSVTLQHVCPDRTSSTDELIKMLDGSVSSPEEVRAAYVQRLCSKLVAVNDEKTALLAENISLREALSSKEKEFDVQTSDASLTARNIGLLLSQLENGESSSSECVASSSTMPDLLSNLNSIYDRLCKLKVLREDQAAQNTCQGISGAAKATSPTMVSVGVLTSHETDSDAPPVYSDPCVPSERIPPTVTSVEQPDDDLAEFGLQSLHARCGSNEDTNQSVHSPSPFVNGLLGSVFPKIGATLRHTFQELATQSSHIDETRTVGAGRGTPQPSYSASQEEPWCPCCHQRFGSRDELETHLLTCLT